MEIDASCILTFIPMGRLFDSNRILVNSPGGVLPFNAGEGFYFQEDGGVNCFLSTSTPSAADPNPMCLPSAGIRALQRPGSATYVLLESLASGVASVRWSLSFEPGY